MKSAALLLLPAMLGGCDLSMQRQARHATQSGASLWSQGPEIAGSPDGTIPIGQPAEQSAIDRPPHLTEAVLRRGSDRYTIFCAPCHGLDGSGDGSVVQRGFPRPPSYHDARLMAAPTAAIVDVIGNGRGAMYGFADKVPPADRWAIAAYVKTLQRLPAGAATP
jgi:mono/diheme cytochrome c family protein